MPVFDAINPELVTFLHADIGGWPITTAIESVKFHGGEKLSVKADHNWPVYMLNGDTAVNANPWVFVQIGGRWFAATYEWLRPNQTRKGIHAANIGAHIKKDPLDTWRPRNGEVVGFCISGTARDSHRTAEERSQIVLVKWGEDAHDLEDATAPPADDDEGAADIPIDPTDPASSALVAAIARAEARDIRIESKLDRLLAHLGAVR
ncbi:MAG: hypothetical protein QF786_00090 [Vicinamibacterales bacterium]|jgi:hypothetical protein|nr:hypothetical protein [Vicinamibacterales bacterium]